MNRNLTIGLTGSFGSGKSTALKIFENFGFKTYSADKEVHHLYSSEEIQEILKKKIPEAFEKKEKIILNKEKLRKIVFSDKEKLTFLENLIHPLIKKQCMSLIQSRKESLACEIPILFNSGLEEHFDKIVTIEANQKTRLRRVVKRHKEKLTEKDFFAIEKSQPTKEERALIADIVIQNDESIEDLKKKIFSFLKY